MVGHMLRSFDFYIHTYTALKYMHKLVDGCDT